MCLWRLDEDVGAPEIGVTNGHGPHVGAGNWARSLERTAKALHRWAIFLTLPAVFIGLQNFCFLSNSLIRSKSCHTRLRMKSCYLLTNSSHNYISYFDFPFAYLVPLPHPCLLLSHVFVILGVGPKASQCYPSTVPMLQLLSHFTLESAFMEFVTFMCVNADAQVSSTVMEVGG